MKFGSVDDPGQVDFALPEDHPQTETVLNENGNPGDLDIYVGCAKWNSKDLKDFYPKGTSDELTYYSKQFNCVEFNATFYNIFDEDQVKQWHDKVPADFKFFPKVNRYISHLKWLNDIEERTDDFIDSIVHFKEKLGTTFLQLRGKFRPKFFDRVQNFVEYWPEGIPLAVEFRHPDWFDDEGVANELYALFEENNIANVITDTAGRRDLLHMRLTNNEAFVRYVGANHPTDVSRLDEWVERLKTWREQGIENIHFFVHQNKEKKSPQLAAHFIHQFNEVMNTEMDLPDLKRSEGQGDLF
ncbi:Uncharacterized conserved protein YecE, DUF72 family [Fodinibius salinus]|uniref:Uncharacterized conserved protein YecE, DUF72 family n=1 Tax=Fodinibius salinus TaxID=860790 RepID=A0A5D3YLW4_9BACT|nr:DUF72 domain-containing protein [Fodinibius salinus]TYP93687.1 Uncharacterized conserved protein YecE, DUF72 family [Fodinibius salinus]